MTSHKTAIFIDGAFFIKKSKHFFGKSDPKSLANQLWYCCVCHADPSYELRRMRKCTEKDNKFQETLNNSLYRIFFYDCPPFEKKTHHVLTKEFIDYSKTPEAIWRRNFHNELKSKRKVALRLGCLDDDNLSWSINPKKVKEMCNGKTAFTQLQKDDFILKFQQKGVDMRIGTDIASVTFKKQASRIVLISGDSDFVPSAKLARREGVEFILDPMRSPIRPDLHEHIDRIQTVFNYRPQNGE